MHVLKPIHPFPARMAPEIALNTCADLPSGSIVLDPMSGSGTVMRAAAEHGHAGVGFDMDPMAVLLTRVWTTPLDTSTLLAFATASVAKARALYLREVTLPWIDKDKETRAFIDFWFARKQKNQLRKLCSVLQERTDAVGDALRVVVSRLIITKERGASLAGDVSHSRPHRIRETNDFDVFKEFGTAVRFIARRLQSEALKGNVEMGLGDARRLDGVRASSIDAVVTSPPYLNAIDYMRAHRMALVWLGHRIGALRGIRSTSVGAERKPEEDADLELARVLTAAIDPTGTLPERRRRMVDRYALDMGAIMREIHRVLKPQGKAVLVVGNSCHRGVYVENSQITRTAAEHAGLCFADLTKREIPPSRRYLPPPTKGSISTLQQRMRTEAVMTFVKTG